MIEREIHGVPLWLLRDYLVELGGETQGDNRVVGDGWVARFARIEPFRIGLLCVGRVRLELEGEEPVLDTLMPRLELKLMRGGG